MLRSFYSVRGRTTRATSPRAACARALRIAVAEAGCTGVRRNTQAGNRLPTTRRAALSEARWAANRRAAILDNALIE